MELTAGLIGLWSAAPAPEIGTRGETGLGNDQQVVRPLDGQTRACIDAAHL